MISIRVDGVDQILQRMTQLEQRRLPFAISHALNSTATSFQQAMRVGIARRFTLRRPQFILNTVRIEKGDFSDVKQGKWRAVVSIGMGQNAREKNTGLLVKFEDGGQKASSDEFQPVAIPTLSLRPSFAERVPTAMYPKNLRLATRRTPDGGELGPNVHTTGGGKHQLKGKRRTFVLGEPGTRAWGVYQRIGPKRTDIRKIWMYRSRVPIPRRLQFRDTAHIIVPSEWKKQLRSSLGRALDRHGGGARADALL